MKFVSALAAVALLASLLFAVILLNHNALYVIGGEYSIPSGQSIQGNIYALFADLHMEPGAQVQGRIYSLCSGLDLAGAPGEQPLAWEPFGFTVRIPTLRHLLVSK